MLTLVGNENVSKEKLIAAIDPMGRLLMGTEVKRELTSSGFTKFELANVFCIEMLVMPSSGGQQIKQVVMFKQILPSSPLIRKMELLPNVWFEITEDDVEYAQLLRERDKLRAAASGLVLAGPGSMPQ